MSHVLFHSGIHIADCGEPPCRGANLSLEYAGARKTIALGPAPLHAPLLGGHARPLRLVAALYVNQPTLEHAADPLRHWLAYHTHLGVERALVYVNDRAALNTSYVRALRERYEPRGALIVPFWFGRRQPFVDQHLHGMHSLYATRGHARWLLSCDVDEYVKLSGPAPGGAGTLPRDGLAELLEAQLGAHPDAVAFQLTDYHVVAAERHGLPCGPLQPRPRHHSLKGKVVFQPARASAMAVHFMMGGERTLGLNASLAVLAHIRHLCGGALAYRATLRRTLPEFFVAPRTAQAAASAAASNFHLLALMPAGGAAAARFLEQLGAYASPELWTACDRAQAGAVGVGANRSLGAVALPTGCNLASSTEPLAHAADALGLAGLPGLRLLLLLHEPAGYLLDVHAACRELVRKRRWPSLSQWLLRPRDASARGRRALRSLPLPVPPWQCHRAPRSPQVLHVGDAATDAPGEAGAVEGAATRALGAALAAVDGAFVVGVVEQLRASVCVALARMAVPVGLPADCVCSNTSLARVRQGTSSSLGSAWPVRNGSEAHDAAGSGIAAQPGHGEQAGPVLAAAVSERVAETLIEGAADRHAASVRLQDRLTEDRVLYAHALARLHRDAEAVGLGCLLFNTGPDEVEDDDA